MLLRSTIAALAALAFHSAAAKPLYWRRGFAQDLEKQNDVSLQGVLDNIGPSGSQAPGASAGAIIASPSTENPNYYYTWTRDSALTMKMLIDEFIHGNAGLQPYIEDYIEAQAILQTVSNPSGALGSGRGLGEPKYYSNLTRFNGDWGRPQRDGPALRATALITYSRYLLDTGSGSESIEAVQEIWPVIQNDLAYVAQYWNATGFDLWEEVFGSSFFTIAVQYRALIEGSALAKALGHDSSAYDSQAPNALCFLQTFWNGNHAVANVNTQAGFSRSGIDANTVIASIAVFDPAAQCDDATFQPCSERALSNLKAYTDAFRTIYTINLEANDSAVATGRYAEDVYFSGNPWYLTTFAVAEQLYAALQQWSSIGSITITDVSLPFWQSIFPSAEIGTYNKLGYGTAYQDLTAAALSTADAYVKVALKYTPSSGALAEQYSRENGTALSARDLTWSYASFVTMHAARLAAVSKGPQVPSWGSPNTQPPSSSSCTPGSVIGSYAPAIAAGAPADTPTCTILVTFNLNATTFYGENVYLTGNTTDVGNFSPEDALPGSATGYTSERPLWTFTVELPAGSGLEYAFLRKEPDGSVVEEDKRRELTVPACADGPGIGQVTVEDAWSGTVPTPPA